MEFSSIRFFKSNPNNDAIAFNFTGAGTPTDEIFTPSDSSLTFSGTIAGTSGSPTITGTGTAFTTEVQVGQLLYAFVSTVPKIIGEVLSITNNTTLVLKSDGPAPFTFSGLSWASLAKIVPSSGKVYMRVEPIVSGPNYTVPSPRFIRQGNTDNTSAPTITSMMALNEVSDAGLPNVEVTATNVDLLFTRTSRIPGPSSGPVSYSAPPVAFWYLLDPLISEVASEDFLPSNLTVNWFVDNDLPSYTIVNNVTLAPLGDSNTSGNTGGYF